MQTITKTSSGIQSFTITRSGENAPNFQENQFSIHKLERMNQYFFPTYNGHFSKTDQIELLWVKKGTCFVQINEYKHQVDINSIAYLSPGHNRKLLLQEDIEGYYISFSMDFLHLLRDGSAGTWIDEFEYYSTIISIGVDEMEHELDFIARKMDREFAGNYNRSSELLKGLLNVFVLYIIRNLKQENKGQETGRDNELVRNFMRLLKKNFIRSKMVSDYASHLCVTPNYLNRTIKKATGNTASHHIQQKIMLEAKKQALYSAISMKEIAYNLGFDNIAHFSKFFKINCGMNFTEYKKHHLTGPTFNVQRSA